MKKKTRLVLIVLALAMFAFATVSFVGCKKGGDSTGPEQPKIEYQAGTYYFDAEGDEYTFSIAKDGSFMLTMNGQPMSGVAQSEDGKSITLAMSNGDKISAKLSGDVLTVSIKGTEYRFLLKTPYTVSFEANGGSAVAPVSVINGKTLSKPADPVYEGHKFLGWYEDADLTKPFMFNSKPVTADTKLYARWVEVAPGTQEFIVSFDLNYYTEESYPDMETVGGKLYDVPTPATRDGYAFKGWYVSMYQDRSKLSYKYEDDIIFKENTTLFAKWENNAVTSVLRSPEVQVTADGVSWNGNPEARNYEVWIVGENTLIQQTTASTFVPFDFASAPAGDYTIRVTACAAVSTNNSRPTEIYYRNKALDRVSIFSVIEPSTLVFNAVENAEKYLITVECGSEWHIHNNVDNGNSTFFNFSGCDMKKGGIVFTVTAVAEGYASSTSLEFVYNRQLAPVSGMYLNDQTQVLSWSDVPNAAEYYVNVVDANVDVTFSVGKATSVSLKEYEPKEGGIIVSVYPATNGYNSPEATTYIYNKETLATPSGLSLNGYVLSWNPVSDATSYEVSVGGTTMTSNTFSVDLTNAVNWQTGADYAITVKAKGNVDSLPCDPFVVRYGTMYEAVTYNRSTLTWRPVVGAAYYEVSVNGGTPERVRAGWNSAEITLTKAGDNTVSVRMNNGTTNSAWVSVNVFAYTVYFDSREGYYVQPVYKAIGDVANLPEAERDGYVFYGWHRYSGSLYKDAYYSEAGDVNLYASWQPATYEVTLDSGIEGGINKVSKVIYGKEYTLSVPDNENTAVVFGGWYAESNASSRRFTDENGKSIGVWEIAENTTVYAIWLQVFEFEKVTMNNDVVGYAVSKGEGIGYISDVVIPAFYKGEDDEKALPVVQIKSYAFQSCDKMITLSLPDSITDIALYDTTSTSTTDPGSAFYRCTKLQSVSVYHVYNVIDPLYEDDGNGVLIYHNVTAEGSPYEIGYYPVAKEGAYVIPEKVTFIRARAFASTLISEVTIHEKVTAVRANAFYNCKNLTKVTFLSTPSGQTPENLEISQNAFQSCTGISEITLPSRISALYFDAFRYCSNLENVYIDGKITATAYVPKGTSSSSGYVAYEGVTLISRDGIILAEDLNGNAKIIVYCPVGRTGAFEIDLGIERINDYAFYNCSKLTSLVIPNSVSEIGNHAFYYAGFTTVTFEGNTPANAPEVTIDDYAFAYNTKLKKVIFEDGNKVASIGNYAFYMDSALQNFDVPANVSSIGNSAFSSCRSMTYFNLDKVEGGLTFGTNIFSGCTGITEITLPAGLETFNVNVFSGCTSLLYIYVDENNANYADEDGVLFNKDITEIIAYPLGRTEPYQLPATVRKIGERVFYQNKSLVSLTIPASVTEIGKEAFREAVNLAEVIFLEPEEGEEVLPLVIGQGAFQSASSATGNQIAMTSVVLPSRLKAIANDTFRYSVNLTEVTLPDGIESIGSYAFSGTSIKEIDLKNVSSIGERAFSSTLLEHVTLPATITTINAYFNSCSNLVSVKYLGQLTSFGGYDFSLCSSLVSVSPDPDSDDPRYQGIFIQNTVVNMGRNTFNQCGSIKSVYFEEGGTETLVMHAGTETATSRSWYGYTFDGDVSLETVHFPARLEVIAQNTFGATTAASACVSLKSVTFEEGSRLKYIGNTAFQNCSALESIVIPKGVANLPRLGTSAVMQGIGNNAFSGCTSLKSVIFEEGGTEPLSFGTTAFKDCASLTTITLPNRMANTNGSGSTTVAALTAAVFGGCTSLESINVQPAAEGGTNLYSSFDGALYNAAGTELIIFPSGKGGEVVIPKTVTTIGNGVFNQNNNVTKVTFESGRTTNLTFTDATSAANAVFYKCNNLTEIVLPSDHITTISRYFVANCDALTTVNVPATVTLIKQQAFYTCAALANVIFEGSDATPALQIGDGTSYSYAAFYNCNLGGSFVLPARTTKIQALCYNSSGLTSITIPAKVGNATSAANTLIYAFYNCKALEEVIFEEGVSFTTLGNYAFYGCAALKKITLPSKITTVGTYIFYNCTELAEVNFTSPAITAFGNYIFYGCSALTSVDLSSTASSVTLGTYAFYNCKNLVEVTLPKGLATSGGMAVASIATTFSSTEKLEKFIIEEGAPRYSTADGVLFNNTGKTLICYPLGKRNISYEIPDGVTTIEQNAFKNQPLLKYITIPGSVTTINQGAFNNATAIEGIEFKEGTANLTINGAGSSNAAFYGMSSLRSITIPARATFASAATYVFANNPSLTSVVFETDESGKSKVTALPADVFYNCPALTSVTLPGSLTSVGNFAFQNCKALVSVTLPDSVTTIGNSVFMGCTALETVIAKGLTTTGSNVFSGCTAITKVTADPEATEGVVIPNAQTLGFSTFINCSSLVDVDLPETLQSIGYTAFKGCSSLKEIVIPASVTTIAGGHVETNLTSSSQTFMDCTSLEKVTFAEGSQLEFIPNFAFQNCVSLKEINIPESAVSIGNKAFSGCTSLEQIFIPKNTVIKDVAAGSYTFENCTSLTSVIFDEDATITVIPAYTFSGCTALVNFSVPASVTTIGNYAFNNATALENVDLYVGLTTIGSFAFNNCVSLKGIYLPGSVNEIGDNPFLGCTGMNSIDLAPDCVDFIVIDNALYNADRSQLISYPAKASGTVTLLDSVSAISAGAFAGSDVNAVIFSDGIESVPANLFDGCANLTTVILGENVTSIGDYAFRGTGVKSIVIGDNVTSIGAGAFMDSAIESVVLGEKVTTIGANAFNGSALKSITMNNKLTTIGNNAFQNTALESVRIPSTVTRIGEYAFENCVALAEIEFDQTGNSVMTIGNYAFRGDTALTYVKLPYRARVTSMTSSPYYYNAIGNYAFADCTSLKKVEFGNEGAKDSLSRMTVGDYAFSGCTALESIDFSEYLGDSSYDPSGGHGGGNVAIPAIGKYAFAGCEKLASVTFGVYPNYQLFISSLSLTVGDYAFSGCTSLEGIELPYIAKTVSKGAFSGSGLKSIVLPELLTTVGEEAFRDCTSLVSVETLGRVSTMNKYVFAGCTALESITNANPITLVYEGAFMDCTSLTSIDVSNATTINQYAFKNCTAIKSITLSAKLATVRAEAFSGWTSEQTIYIAFASADDLPANWYEGWDTDCNATIVFGA